MDLWQMISEWINNGTLPTLTSVITFVVVVGLEVAKNKLIKKVSDDQEEIKALNKKIDNLETIIATNNNVGANTNEIVSLMVDILHIAYNNSKLPESIKLAIQKLYDACPNGVKEQLSASEILEAPATEEQVAEVEATKVEDTSYASIIANKLSSDN